jgi:hypothetical protein
MGVQSVGAMLMSIPVGMDWFPEQAKFNPADWPGFLIEGATFFVLGLLAYVVAWTLGWIVAGFVGEGDKNST